VVFDQTTYKPQIQLTFNTEGAKLFADITARNIGKPLAIYLDGESIVDTNGDNKIDGSDTYAPIIQAKITGGTAVITRRYVGSNSQLHYQPVKLGSLAGKDWSTYFQRP